MEPEPFTKVMRKATRGIHSISDALINAKLGIAMSNDRVWAEGLLIFYEIFKFLEGAVDRLEGSIVQELNFPGMKRTAAFEKDLEFYLGQNWREARPPHPSVQDYVAYLSTLERRDPTLLLAYIYHLYMGLFSGGQILRKKRALARKLTSPFSPSSAGGDPMEGLAVLDLEGGTHVLKTQMRAAMDKVAKELDEDTVGQLLEESKKVFVWNNRVVAHIPGANRVLVDKLVTLGVLLVILALLWYYLASSSVLGVILVLVVLLCYYLVSRW